MDTRPDIFAVNVGNDGKVRIIDLIYTAFMRAKLKKGNPDNNGPFDWFSDTYPMMVEQIGKWEAERKAEIEWLREENKYLRQQWGLARNGLADLASRANSHHAGSDDLRGL